MQNLNVACLYSSVRNMSGGRRKFGFLPPHGKELAANEEYTVYGDIRQAMIRFERSEARRNIIAFEAALARGDIEIINTTSPILADTARAGATPMMLTLTDGVLGVTSGCWGASDSVSDADV